MLQTAVLYSIVVTYYFLRITQGKAMKIIKGKWSFFFQYLILSRIIILNYLNNFTLDILYLIGITVFLLTIDAKGEKCQCPPDRRPVCANNFETYPNICTFKCIQMSRPNLSIIGEMGETCDEVFRDIHGPPLWRKCTVKYRMKILRCNCESTKWVQIVF